MTTRQFLRAMNVKLRSDTLRRKHRQPDHDGSIRVYYWPQGSMKQEYRLDENGRRHGTFVELYPDGKLCKLLSYEHGNLHGTLNEWAPNGQLTYQGTYEHGHAQGEVRTWYDDGSPQIRASYRHGRPHGEHLAWDENGNVIRHVVYHRGKEVLNPVGTP